MKKIILLTSVILIALTCNVAIGQCTPGDEITCPDPEENGEICPDSLAGGFYMEPYNQEITILPPVSFETGQGSIDLHHITLLAIDNLPEGITWESNAPDDEFMAGVYHCILLSGTPADTGSFPMHIQVEVFIQVLPSLPPVSAGIQTDSSIAMIISPEASGIADDIDGFSILKNNPNPFSQTTSINFTLNKAELIWIHVYDLTGQCLHQTQIKAESGINNYLFDGTFLQAGMYICRISTPYHKASMKLIKTR